MIKSLALTNFKSIGKTLLANDDSIEEGKLDFTPLTVFCGKNSSGKSTVLQSILLLVQTLQNNVPSNTLVLNGPMVRLGSVDDIKSTFTKSEIISIGITFDTYESVQKFIDFTDLKGILIKQKEKANYFEEEINIDGYGKLNYFLSNNIDDISKEIFIRTGLLIDKVNDTNFKKNPSLSTDVRNIMDKYQTTYSMTTYKKQGVYTIAINKKINNECFFLLFEEKDGQILTNTSFNKNEFVFSDNFLFTNEFNDIKSNQSISLIISFCNKKINDISNIIPKIINIGIANKITLFNDHLRTEFLAVHKNKSKKIRTKYSDFEYYSLKTDDFIKLSIPKNTLSKYFIKQTGLKLNHFLPKSFVYLLDVLKYTSNHLVDSMFYEYFSKDFEFDNQSVTSFNDTINKLAVAINSIAKEGEHINISHCIIPNTIVINNKNSFIKNAKASVLKIKRMKNSFFYKLVSWYNAEFNKNKDTLMNDINKFTHVAKQVEIGSILQTSVDNIVNYFQNNIFYIGPLREEPRLQYNTYIDNTMDVGNRGENLPNVLYQEKGKYINYIDPDDFDKMMATKKCLLGEAVNKWIKYIGIAEGVDVKFKGRYGYELKILSFDKKTSNDLTNVGVGVSQVLPIILICLLAPEKSTIIIEQPELHLHPKMQSKLTDFFIAISYLGKQCIIETHTEHIINRLRYQVAKMSSPHDEKLANDIQIYFSDKNEKGTVFKSITMDKYAYISDWPEDFFDEAEISNVDTLRAINKKLEEDT